MISERCVWRWRKATNGRCLLTAAAPLSKSMYFILCTMKQWPAWLMGLKMPHFDGRPGDVVWSFTLTNSIIMLLDGQSGKSLSAGAHGWNQQQSSLIKKKIVYAQRSSEYNYHTAFCFFFFACHIFGLRRILNTGAYFCIKNRFGFIICTYLYSYCIFGCLCLLGAWHTLEIVYA